MYAKRKIQGLLLLGLLFIFWGLQSPSVQAYDEHIVLDLDSEEYHWGWTDNSTKKWWDNTTSTEEDLIHKWDTDDRAGSVGSPTGASQTHDTVFFMYAHDYTWGWSNNASKKYRPNPQPYNQTTGPETDFIPWWDGNNGGTKEEAVDNEIKVPNPEGSSGSQETPQNRTYRYKLRVFVVYNGTPIKLVKVNLENLPEVHWHYTNALGWVTFTLPRGTHRVIAWHPDYGYVAETIKFLDHMQITLDMMNATPEIPEEDDEPKSVFEVWWGQFVVLIENFLAEREISPRTLSWLALPILALGAFLIFMPKDKKKRRWSYSYAKKSFKDKLKKLIGR